MPRRVPAATQPLMEGIANLKCVVRAVVFRHWGDCNRPRWMSDSLPRWRVSLRRLPVGG